MFGLLNLNQSLMTVDCLLCIFNNWQWVSLRTLLFRPRIAVWTIDMDINISLVKIELAFLRFRRAEHSFNVVQQIYCELNSAWLLRYDDYVLNSNTVNDAVSCRVSRDERTIRSVITLHGHCGHWIWTSTGHSLGTRPHPVCCVTSHMPSRCFDMTWRPRATVNRLRNDDSANASCRPHADPRKKKHRHKR